MTKINIEHTIFKNQIVVHPILLIVMLVMVMSILINIIINIIFNKQSPAFKGAQYSSNFSMCWLFSIKNKI